jgi:hypothetical protein
MVRSLYRNRLFSIVIIPVLILISFEQTPITAEDNSDKTGISEENVAQIQVLDSLKLATINQLAWSRDEKRLAVATQDGVWLYNVADGSTKQIGEKEIADDISFLGDTTQVAINYDNQALIFDTETSKVIRQLPSRFDRISYDGQTYAVVTSEAIQLFSIADDTLLNQIPIKYVEPCEYACVINDIAFSADDEFIVFSSGAPEVENGIVDLKTNKQLSSIQLGIWGLEFNPDGSIIASLGGELGYLSRSVEFTDSKTGQLIATFKTFESSPPIFNSDGHLVVVSGLDENAPNPDEASAKLYFFDIDKVKKGENLDVSLAIRTDMFSTWLTSAQFSPTSKYLAIGDKDGNLYLLGFA